MQQQLNDMVEFWNIWCRMDYAKDGNDIYTIRHREAMFSRWEMQNRRGDINWHYYCAGWDQQPGTDKYPIIPSRVIDEFNAVEELKICPFCGNKDVTIMTRRGKNGWRDYFYVLCDYNDGGCGALSGWYHYVDEAIEAWNKRADDGKE